MPYTKHITIKEPQLKYTIDSNEIYATILSSVEELVVDHSPITDNGGTVSHREIRSELTHCSINLSSDGKTLTIHTH
jgi:hypothetical protein